MQASITSAFAKSSGDRLFWLSCRLRVKLVEILHFKESQIEIVRETHTMVHELYAAALNYLGH
jgi:hypothetical protein